LPLTSQPVYNVCLPVLSNREIVPEIFLLALEEPRLAAAARPGQFVMCSIPPLKDPFLPRPFAVFNAEGSRIEIVYKRVGKGTALLADLRAGDVLRVLGPLGNGFSPSNTSAKALVLAGGIGIASVHFLLVHLLKGGGPPPTLLYGVRSTEELVPLEPLERSGLLLHIATEDGKRGVKGIVSDLLSTVLEQEPRLARADTEAFVCGPVPMLKAVARQMASLEIKAYFSLESRMACGYGVCQGCVIPIREEKEPKSILYRKVCMDGPVFPAEEISWEEIP
jgi:dihydroorotate dehydrogenase electron transfer subunit